VPDYADGKSAASDSTTRVNLFGSPPVVAVEERDDFAAALRYAEIKRGSLAAVALVDVFSAGEFLDQVAVVFRTVIARGS